MSLIRSHFWSVGWQHVSEFIKHEDECWSLGRRYEHVGWSIFKSIYAVAKDIKQICHLVYDALSLYGIYIYKISCVY